MTPEVLLVCMAVPLAAESLRPDARPHIHPETFIALVNLNDGLVVNAGSTAIGIYSSDGRQSTGG